MASINSQLTTGKKEKGVGNGTVKRITVVPAQMKVLNPYGTPEDNTADDPIEVFNESKVSFLSIGDPMPPSRRDDSMASLDLISPLSPKMKGTFMDKLPTWHETSQSVSPETLLNIHAGREKKAVAIAAKEAAEKKMKNAASKTMPLHPKPPQFSMLHASAITGDKQGLAKLLSPKNTLSKNVDLRDKYGRTPLIFAILGDHAGCAEVLLKNGANPGLKDKAGRNALHWAAHHGHVKCLRTLLAAKTIPKWSERDKGGVTLLHLVTRRASTKALPMILKHFAISKEQINIPDKNKRTALHWAASTCCSTYVSLLLKHGASVSIPDIEGKTPLHWAASYDESQCTNNEEREDSRRCIEMLIEHSPNTLNWQDYEGRTPLHSAVANGDLAASEAVLNSRRCQLNITDRNSCTALHFAAQLGKTEQVLMLLDMGASSSIRDEAGATPLHYATSAGYMDTVEALMRHPEVMDEPDISGRTALIWTSGMEDRADMIQSLCRHGADLSHKDARGNTALHVACLSNQLTSVEALLRMGADPCAPNVAGQTPLSLCSAHGHAEAADALLTSLDEAEALDLLSRPDLNGMLPLHWTCARGHADMMVQLLSRFEEKNSASKSIEQTDSFGRTCAILAAANGSLNCLQILIKEHGSSINLETADKLGHSPLHWASQKGHLDVVKLLLEQKVYVNPAGLKIDPKVGPTNREFVTPLDLAIQHNHSDIAKLLAAKGGLTMEKITKIAATRIQALYRSYRIRKSFQEHRHLLIKHERLRAAKSAGLTGHAAQSKTGRTGRHGRSKQNVNKATENVSNAAMQFLGHVIEETHTTAAFNDNPDFHGK